MTELVRYARLYGSFARYCLVREMTFRVNFLVRCAASVGWLCLLILFFELIFQNTRQIGDWSRWQYYFFMGTSWVVRGLADSLFVENCSRMAELIRTGDLDFALLKPIDEQFLLSCQKIDFAEIPEVFFGFSLMGVALVGSSVVPSPIQIGLYLLLVLAGLSIFYSVMLVIASSSVWMVRNQSFYELWWYVTQFSRYPAEIYRNGALGWSLYIGFTYVFPVLLAVNIPARVGIGLVSGSEWFLVVYLLVGAGVLLAISRWFFKTALTSYRSASS